MFCFHVDMGQNRKKMPQHPVALVTELTTLRWHMQSQHNVARSGRTSESREKKDMLRKRGKEGILFGDW